MKVRNVMVKYGSFRLNSNTVSFAGLKSSLVVALCTMLLIQSTIGTAQEPAQQPQSNQAATTEISSSQPPEELPSAPVPQSSSQPQQQDQQAQQTQTPQQPPVGTAAAPYEKPTGVPGSRPAGAAIAPAKQRRVRAIVISLGLVLAGAGAIGAVAGMSKASHSTP